MTKVLTEKAKEGHRQASTKQCLRCKKHKEWSEFYRNRSRKDGLMCECKECCRIYLQSNKGKESRRISSMKYQQRCPEKVKAHNIVNHAIESGKVERPSICESCFEEKVVEAHHEDYNKPLEVIWICIGCHKEHHAKNRK